MLCQCSIPALELGSHVAIRTMTLLQNLGKVDRTADEIFDEHLTNFNRQHTCATRLQKEFSNYIRCVRAVQNASKSLMDAITEVYESQWTGSEVLYGQTKTIDTQYQQFSYKLADQVLKQLDTYALQFPEMKVTRGREQLEEAKSTYEVLNSELHDELPALYDSRILFLVTNLQTLFACEQQFHSETSKVYADLEAIVDKLATESQRGSYTLKKINANSNPSSPQQSPVKANLSIVNNVTNGSANANGHTSAQNVLPSTPRTPSPAQPRPEQQDDDEPSYQNTEVVKAAAAAAKTSTPNGNAKQSELEQLNGNASTSGPKENGHQPAAVTEPETESTPAITTNGTLHPHPQSSTNQLPTDQTHTTTANGGINNNNTISSNARVVPENGVPERKTPTKGSNVASTMDGTGATAAAAADAAAVAASANADADVPTPTTTTTAGAAVSQTTAGQSVLRMDKVTQTPPATYHPPPTTAPMMMMMVTPAPKSSSSSNNNNSLPFTNPPSVAHHQHHFPSHHATNVTLNNLNNNAGNATNARSPLLIAQYPQPHAMRAGLLTANAQSGLLCDVPVGAATAELPPGVLYRVKATYKYVREDVDELSFEVGDVINVVEYEDPEDQEEGWLMGTKDGSNEKGMFPANFTRPL
uniref:Uncharacterized protein n=1 Tax=Anopheles minimus TaxID=112268 RepID=A0A182WB69_9DIPT